MKMRQFVIFDTGGDFFAVHGNDLKAMLDFPLPDYPNETVFLYAKQGEPAWLRAVEVAENPYLFAAQTRDATNDLLEIIAERILDGCEWDYDDCDEGGNPNAIHVDEWVKDTQAYEEAQQAELDEYLNSFESD